MAHMCEFVDGFYSTGDTLALMDFRPEAAMLPVAKLDMNEIVTAE